MTQFAKKLRAILEKAGQLEAECDARRHVAGRGAAAEASVHRGARQEGRPATEQELVELIAKAANIPPIDLSKLNLNKEVLESVPEDVARDYGVFPVDKIGSIITVAVANPFDVLKLDDIRIVTGCQLRLVVSTEEEIERTRRRATRPKPRAWTASSTRSTMPT